jgi:hypothetical protein
MDGSTYSSFGLNLPPQKLSEKQKDKAWGEACVRAIANRRDAGNGLYRKSRQEMQIAYDLINGKFDPSDVQHVINPTANPVLKKMGGLPAKYQHYDIIASKLNELLGEEIKRPFNFRAYGVSGGVLSRQKEKRNQLVLQGLQNLLLQEMGQEADPEQVPLEQVEEFFKSKYKDPAEVGANQILKALVPKLRIQMLFNKGFSHVLPVGEEIYNVSTTAGEPTMRCVNPLYSSYDLDPDLDFIEDGQWFREERWLPAGAIVDEFREYLEPGDVAKLDRRQEGGSYSWRQQLGFAYQPGTDDGRDRPYYAPGMDPGNQGHGGHGPGDHTGELICVVQVCWRSMREIAFLHYPDEDGKMQQVLVDPQTIKLSAQQKAAGARLERQWITDIWEGTMIGADIFVKVRPLPNQTGKLPYLGYVYSRLNSRATSLVDRVKPLQYLYNVVWFRLENELAKAHGKSVAVDLAGIPRSGEWGMSTDEWLYYKDVVGIMFYDSSQEGNENPQNARAMQVANSSIDQGISANVGQYISITREIKEMVGSIIGVSRQREGNITSNETVGGVDRAVSQSNNITEPLFYYHNLVKQNVLTQLVEVAKLCYADGTHGQYIIDDVSREWLQVDGGLLNDSSYEVYIRDASKDAALIQKMEMLADRMFQTGEVRASTILQMLDEESISARKGILLQAEEAGDKRKQAEAEQQQAMQTEQLQAQALERDSQRQYEATQNALDRDNEIRGKYITATKGATGDGNANGQPDGLDFIKATNEAGKMSLQQLKVQADATQKQLALQAKQQADAQTAAQKQQELTLKLQQHTDKTALEQTKLQLQAQDMQFRSAQFRAEQVANAAEQKQQNRMHEDKKRHDRELLALKQKEVKAKLKQASKRPTPKK